VAGEVALERIFFSWSFFRFAILIVFPPLLYISYRGALLSTLLHDTVYMFLHSLLNVLVQIANKMGLQRNTPQRPLTYTVALTKQHAIASSAFELESFLLSGSATDSLESEEFSLGSLYTAYPV
jgi:hypothetical protein